MIKVKIICVGKLKEKFLRDAFDEYKKRLTAFCKFELVEIDEYKLKNNPTESEIKICIDSEGERIFSKIINNNAYLIALCVEGKSVSSEDFSSLIKYISINRSSEIVFIIGGSYGLSNKIKKSASYLLSMSKLTFPHQLARIILCEQIYRAFQILSGGKYHK